MDFTKGRVVALLFIIGMVTPGFAQEKEEPKIQLRGVVEVKASYQTEKSDGGEEGSTSGIALATVNLFLDAELRENIKVKVAYLHENVDTEPGEIDEGYITISRQGLSLIVGRQYLPFGVYNSHFVSDPFTLELGETREAAVMLGYEKGVTSTALGFFNGSIDKVASDNTIDDFVGAITLSPCEGLTINISYLSDLADTNADILSGVNYGERIGGISGSLSLTSKKFSLEGEIVSATEKSKDIDDRKPLAYNLEFAYPISERLELALKYERSEDFNVITNASDISRYGIGGSYKITGDLSLGAEILLAEDKDNTSINAVTIQLAIEF